MTVIEFPSQSGVRLKPRPGWRVQPPPIHLRPRRRETLAEFLGVVTDPEFQKSIGRILAAEAFGENPDMQFTAEAEEIAAYRRAAYDEAGRVFDFLVETASLDPRDRRCADQQREYQRRTFARNVSGEAVGAMKVLLAQRHDPEAEAADWIAEFRRRKRTLRQVSRGVDPRLAAVRARSDDDYRKWVLFTNTGVPSGNQAEAILRVGLVNYREYRPAKQR